MRWLSWWCRFFPCDVRTAKRNVGHLNLVAVCKRCGRAAFQPWGLQ